ncbi:MAG: ABC transporter substrate-binding protein [Burkholderiaceae bacterium]
MVNLAPRTLADVLDCLRMVGKVAGVAVRAEHVIAHLRSRIDAVAVRSAAALPRPRVVLLEWLNPPFSCGHWTPELVNLAGGIELLGRTGEHSHTLRWNEVEAAEPDVIVVACCGFDLARTQQDLAALESVPEWNRLSAVRNGRVFVTDGSQYFSCPGPRLVDSLEILAHALHPDIHRQPRRLPRALTLVELQRESAHSDA